MKDVIVRVPCTCASLPGFVCFIVRKRELAESVRVKDVIVPGDELLVSIDRGRHHDPASPLTKEDPDLIKPVGRDPEPIKPAGPDPQPIKPAGPDPEPIRPAGREETEDHSDPVDMLVILDHIIL